MSSSSNSDLASQFSLVPPIGWAPLVRRNQGVQVRRMAEFVHEEKGKQNRTDVRGLLISGTADTERQRMLSTVRFRPYKLVPSSIIVGGEPLQDDPDYDYYALDGYFEQSAFGSEFVSASVVPPRTYQALGYFADTMRLDLEFFGDGAEVFEFAPTSTVGTRTESFTVGLTVTVGFGTNAEFKGNLGPAASLATSLAWTRSYSAPAVTMTPSRTRSRLNFLVNLPGLDYALTGSETPKPPAMSYFFEPQVIVRVKKGSGLFAAVRSRVNWMYVWPSGTINDEIVIEREDGFGINAFFIEDVVSKEVLDVQEWGWHNAAVGTFQRKSGSDARNQLWYFGPDGTIRSLWNHYCLATAVNDPTQNRLITWEPTGELGQQWLFRPANPRDDAGFLTSRLGVHLVSLPGSPRSLAFRRDTDPVVEGEGRQWRLVFPEGGVL